LICCHLVQNARESLADGPRGREKALESSAVAPWAACRRGRRPAEFQLGETEANNMILGPWTIILGLFLMHVAEFVGAVMLIEWLVRWFASATTAEAALMFAVASGAAATVAVLVAHGRLGVIAVVAVIVFWSIVIFGATGTTAINVIAIAGAILVVAATVVLIESFMARREA